MISLCRDGKSSQSHWEHLEVQDTSGEVLRALCRSQQVLLPPTSQNCSANVLIVIKELFIPHFLVLWEGLAVYLTGILCL